MKKTLIATLFGILLPFVLPHPSQAETVLEKVARTGVLTMGTNYNIIPYVYVDGDKNLVGYSMDVAELIRAELETLLGRKVILETVELENEGKQILAIQNKEIDIACPVRFTWERDKFVDFSLSYSISGIRTLSKRNNSFETPEALIGKRIGVYKGSLGEQAMKLVQPKTTTVSFTNIETALNALDAGKIDGITGDTVLLGGAILPRNQKQYKLSPVVPYARFGVACMVPENNSRFLDTVNYAIVKLMEGYVTDEPKSKAIINRWLGPDGLVSISPDLIEGFFETVIFTREQIPLDAK